jgi:16S rRNA (guanine527-N7)-methyltransferase
VKSEVLAVLEGLARRHGLSGAQQAQLRVVLERLAHDEQAPTSVKGGQRAVDVHLADSLAALDLDAVRAAERIVDIGAGAGFPGVPLAIALPRSEVTLVDSQARKCAFIERVLADAEIGNARVVCARVEEWPEGIGVHDAVLARALGPQPVVLEYAAPLLRLAGSLIDWRGQRDAREEQAALAAAQVLGMRRSSIRRVEPFEGARNHHLHLYTKTGETPDRFPRRVGTARKRPLA